MRVPAILAITLLFLSLAGCAAPEPKAIEPAEDIAEVIDPFLKALRSGNQTEAEGLISSAATDELTKQFAADHKLLAAAAPLTPRFILEQPDLGVERDSNETTLVYAARKDGKWTSATIRLNRYRDEPYEIEYWRITNAAPQPVVFSTNEQKAFKEIMPGMVWVLIGTGLLGLLFVGGLIWLVRRRPHLVNPEAEAEQRAAAVSTREEEQI